MMNIQLKTDQGRVRASNQDDMRAVPFSDGAVLAAVCDGMGGANGGNVASGICIDTLEAYLRAHYDASLPDDDALAVLAAALTEANHAVYARAHDDPALAGMGTTAVAALVRGERLLLANVGDSRAILFHDGVPRQLTKDHSYVQAMVDSGRLTAQEAERHPKKHLITRAIGISAHVEVDCFAERWTQNDVLLLCSDGLTNEVSYAEMAEMLSAVPYAELADALIARANANGGHDNSTVLLLRQDCE